MCNGRATFAYCNKLWKEGLNHIDKNEISTLSILNNEVVLDMVWVNHWTYKS